MNKVRGKFALTLTLMFLLANFTGFIHSSAAVKKPVIPQIKFVKTPSTTYTAGDRVKFDIYAPNCSSTVEYRVVLWDGNKKTYSDLWNSSNGCPTHYYTKWRPNGRTTFKLGWNINEPGSYRITVYVKRVGVAPNKAHLSKYNCDSYMQSAVFTVKPKALILNKEGATYGSTDSNNRQVVKTNINIAAKNITYNNADIIGDTYLSADNITLKNFHVYGTLFLDPGINSSFNLDDVHADKIEIKSLRDSTYEFKNVTTGGLLIKTKNNVTFKAGSGTTIQYTAIYESANVENEEGSFGDVYLVGNKIAPITVSVKGYFNTPVVIQDNAILKSDKNSVNVKVKILPVDNKVITATLDGRFGNVDIMKNSIVRLNSNSWIGDLNSYDYATVYADESSTIDSIRNNTDSLSLEIHGKVKYSYEDNVVFVTDNSVLPTSSEIGGTIKAQLYYGIQEYNNKTAGVNDDPVLRMQLFKADGSPLNVVRGEKFYIYNGKEVLRVKYYNGDMYTLGINKDDGTIKISGGSYKIYAPVYDAEQKAIKWYVLSFTAKQISTTGVNRSEITSVNGLPYKFTRWVTPKYSVLNNGANKSYITIGSKLNDVLRVLGKPTARDGSTESYEVNYYYEQDAFGRYSPGVTNYIQLVMINGTYTVVGWGSNGYMNVKLQAAVSTAPPVRIGATMEDVAKVMGTPRGIKHYYNEDEWDYINQYHENGKYFYKISRVYFSEGRVIKWYNDGNLKVDVVKKDLAAPPFKLGSTMQEVLKAMGTPTGINQSPWASKGAHWSYGESTVGFSPTTGLVYWWDNTGNLNLSMGEIDPQALPFTLGSSMVDVAKANGTPMKCDIEADGGYTWLYPVKSYSSNNYNIVNFDKNGKVIGWNNYNSLLKVWLGDKDPSAPKIKIGSTKEEVIKYLGTPLKIYDNTWNYPNCDVNFDTDGKVSLIYPNI